MSDSKGNKVAKWAMETLVKLYPRSFRGRFGDEIVQTFSDVIDAVNHEGRSVLLATVGALYDASAGIVTEWIKLIFTIMFKTEFTTRVAAVLIVPFFVLVAVSIFGDFLFSVKILSVLTVDGQQLNGLGRVFVFGSVLLLLGSLVVNLAGSVFSRRPDTTLVFTANTSSIALGAVQLITVMMIAVWMFAEAVGCTRGVCD